MVCIGEGEEALVELVRKMEKGEDYHDVEGIWFREGGGIRKNAIRPFIQDLDGLPFPDYDVETQYALIDGALQRVTDELLRRTLGPYYMTLTTRGCPYRCTYCWNHTINRMHPGEKVVRKRSVADVIQELEDVRRRFPFVRMICIDDDAFFLRDLEEIKAFSVRYKERVGLPLWVTGATPSTLTRGKLASLVEAGLCSVRMGIQSASPKTRALYARNHSNEQILRAAEVIDEFRHRIREPQYDVILDNPWEKEKDVVCTLKLLAQLPVPYRLFLFPLTFYPGTDLYEKAQREDLRAEDEEERSRERHHRVRNTYLNRLFFLLDERASQGKRISPRMMRWLTSPWLGKIGLSQAVYTRVRAGRGESLRAALKDLLWGPRMECEEIEVPSTLLPPHME